jgi:hypothetical protein
LRLLRRLGFLDALTLLAEFFLELGLFLLELVDLLVVGHVGVVDPTIEVAHVRLERGLDRPDDRIRLVNHRAVVPHCSLSGPAGRFPHRGHH